jgi:two-component system chemotaxis response regulator CheY
MKTILLANHDVSTLDRQREILTQGGYLIIGEAKDVELTVEKFKELAPDIVILGVHLSKFDGIQALKSIKTINKNALVIMCSDLVGTSKVIDAVKNGAKDWVALPFQADRLLESVKKVLAEIHPQQTIP